MMITSLKGLTCELHRLLMNKPIFLHIQCFLHINIFSFFPLVLFLICLWSCFFTTVEFTWLGKKLQWLSLAWMCLLPLAKIILSATKKKNSRGRKREKKNCVELFSALVCHRKSKFLFISRVLVHFWNSCQTYVKRTAREMADPWSRWFSLPY